MNNSEKIELHENDLPQNLELGNIVAIDTETTGLSLTRDRLCLVQLSAGNKTCHIIQIKCPDNNLPNTSSMNLKKLLANTSVLKLFHYGRFDLAMLSKWIGPVFGPVYCTKIASKLVRTYTDRHGLKDLCQDLLRIEISKEQQSSDWAVKTLLPKQLQYAAQDVIYLHELRTILNVMLEREGRSELAESCFNALKTRVELDLNGWAAEDIFSH